MANTELPARVIASRELAKQLAAARLARWQAEVESHDARNGELPKRPQAEIDLLKQQIDAARTARQTAKASLDAARVEKLTLKTTLQTQLDAAVGAAAKAPIRASLDAVNAEIDQLRIDIDAATLEIEQLRIAKEDTLYQERITKGTTTVEDAPRIQRDKAARAADIEDKRARMPRPR